MNLNLCRLCYENEGNVNIFRGNDVQMCAKIKICCGIKNVEQGDGLPPLICSVCEPKLNTCYQFVQKCIAADEKIRYLLFTRDATWNNRKQEGCPKREIKSELNDLEDDDYHETDEPLPHSFVELKRDDDLKLKNEHVQNPDSRVNYGKKRVQKRLKVNKEDLMCSACGRKCLSLSALAIHMRTHTDERPFHCTLCDKTYKDRGTLKRHIERNHLQKRERKFICENCGKGFYSKSDIQIHMRVHTGETPYTCPICPARFTQMSAMLRHKRRHTDEKSHMCSTCGKPFWTKEELKKHFSVHENVRNFSCPICEVQFKHKGSIQKHMRIHSEPNRFVCSQCGKTFNNKGNLKSHMERKHSERSGYCNTCSKNVSNIEVHMWRHTGQRPLKCEFCTSSFYEMKALALHINFKHKKTDKFKCTSEGCTKSFPSKPMLMFHVAKFHEQQTPHSCERCSRGFYRKNDLARHMLGTHKERLL